MERNPELGTPRKLAERCSTAVRKIGHNTIERMMSPDKSSVQPRLDTIVAVAKAFRIQPEQLISPALDPDNPHDSYPPAEVIALARRLWEKRDSLLDLLGPDAISDQEMEALGWKKGIPPAAAVHQKNAAYVAPPRQHKIRLK
jgi:hypothetical protein